MTNCQSFCKVKAIEARLQILILSRETEKFDEYQKIVRRRITILFSNEHLDETRCFFVARLKGNRGHLSEETPRGGKYGTFTNG